MGAFFTTVLIARVLGPDLTGVYSLVSWGVVVITALAATGFGFAVTKFVGQYDGPDTRDIALALAGYAQRQGLYVTLALAGVLAALSWPLAELFGEPDAAMLFVLAAAVSVPAAMTRVVAAPLQGLQRQAVFLPLTVAQALLTLAGAGIVLALGGGVAALLVMQLVVFTAILALHGAALRRVVRVSFRARLESALRRRLNGYARTLTWMAGLDLVVWQRSEVVMLGAFASSSKVAFYSIAYAMAEAVQKVVPTALTNALFPGLARAFETDDRAFAERAYRDTIRLVGVVTVPVAAFGAVMADPIITVVYGERFAGAVIALQILLFSEALRRLGYSFSSLLFAADRERLLLWLTVAWAVLNVALGLALIPVLGVAGAAATNAATQLAAISTGPVIIRRIMRFRFPFATLGRIGAASALMAFAAWAAERAIESDVLALLAATSVAVPVYVGAVLAFGVIRRDEREALAKRLRRRG